VLAGVTTANVLPHRVLSTAETPPDNFCWQPQDLTATMDQGACGSCWAHAVSSVLGDRISVATNGATRTALSVQQIMECSNYLKTVSPVGCEGNEIYIALKSLVDKGAKLDARAEYLRQYAAAPSSSDMCSLGGSSGRYNVTVESAFLISEPITAPGDAANLRNIANMKAHIYYEGPIVGSFVVYSDFMDYDGQTIYEPSAAVLADKSKIVGGHAIELIGWGVDPQSGAGYWVGRNSWGTAWPSSHKKCAGTGTFYFRMGLNTCEMEAWCAGAKPIPHSPNLAPRDAGGANPEDTGCDAGSVIHKMRDVTSLGSGTGAIVVGVSLLALLAIAGSIFYVHHYKKLQREQPYK
jgi:hypothetical protein